MGIYEEAIVATRQNMMDAFFELYCEKRIEKITVKEIMGDAIYSASYFFAFLKSYVRFSKFTRSSIESNKGR